MINYNLQKPVIFQYVPYRGCINLQFNPLQIPAHSAKRQIYNTTACKATTKLKPPHKNVFTLIELLSLRLVFSSDRVELHNHIALMAARKDVTAGFTWIGGILHSFWKDCIIGGDLLKVEED